MAELFFTYLRISFFAGVMILAVLLIRPLLRKAPRNITCILWLLVAVRLLIPFELESPLSLQPRPMNEPIPIIGTDLQWTSEQAEQDPVTQIPEEPVTNVQPAPQKPVTEPQRPFSLNLEPETVLTAIWIFGCAGLLLYAAVSLIVLRHRVQDAVRCPDGVWESDRIADAFLLGYWKPRIYLPAVLPHRDRELIVAHERSHQSRGDQWWKLLGLVCLSAHWFNPLVWLGFWLMCRDIEAACDERVIRNLDLEQRKDYSMALLNSGKRMSGFLTYPVSFGEVSLKERIKGVLSYRKPGIQVTAVAVALTLVVAVCFMTNPKVGASVIYKETTQTTEATAEPTVLPETVPTEPATVPTETETVPSTEPATVPTEPTTTKPAPTEPEPTAPTKPEPTPTEPTVPVPPSVAPTEPKPEPTQPSVTTPTEPEVTSPPTTAPTEPPVTVPPTSAPEQETIGGKCGDDVFWEYNEETQHLTLRGSGPMDIGSPPPWSAYRSQIRSVTIGDGITTICYAAFSDCVSISSISIPGSVTRIGEEAFQGCTSLKTVQLREGLQKIGNRAFRSTGIKSVHIPKTVNRVESGAFSRCAALSRITFTGNAPIFETNVFSETTVTVYYPELNGSWDRIMDRCGDNVTWVLICTNHSYISGVCERCGAKKGA